MGRVKFQSGPNGFSMYEDPGPVDSLSQGKMIRCTTEMMEEIERMADRGMALFNQRCQENRDRIIIDAADMAYGRYKW